MGRKSFSEQDTIRVLLWCGRHCCLCERPSGVGIEVAHLPGKESSSDIQDAIPLCFDCHAAVGHYNKRHPRGRNYRIEELKATRDQVFDKYTSHLVPPVSYELTQQTQLGSRRLPDVGFQIGNLGDTYAVQARVKIILAQGTTRYLVASGLSGHYNGKHLWNLNPRKVFGGHFEISSEILQSDERLRARIDVALVDIYKREHQLLPVGYIHGLKPNDQWYPEASMEELQIEAEPAP
jgi:hypothetical protein